ncbi:deacetylase Oant_2987-like [Nematostella vectensis]|uniref:deacetylase Oant_2987-like n=1 Tax=Nematostella vectensis TaxID=45351 RepID=UPI0013904BC9|nr:deacetylase Oant_2987-like [Nematostella vectensis]
MLLEIADVVIKNGHVIDPANGIDGVTEVAMKDGKIMAVGDNLEFQHEPLQVFDAKGCLVMPGLIDMHTHVYQYATPLGVNADETCLSRGVTTVVDAGSAGATTFQGLCKYVAEKSQTRVFAFVHVANHGLSSAGCTKEGGGGECDSLNQVDPAMCADCIASNRDITVGVKVRLSWHVSNNGANELESYRRALAASKKARVPLMVHHAISTIPTDDIAGHDGLSCPGSLMKGDIYTHCFSGFNGTIIDPATKQIYSSVLAAHNRGVIFDVGHGRGSFSWTVAELCASQDFWPDVISTDLHVDCQKGPAYDLPTVMTKMLHVGMPLNEIIKAVTITPATVIGWGDTIGSLSKTKVADVTVLREEACSIKMEDSQGQVRTVEKRLVPVAVWRKGEQHQISMEDVIPCHNIEALYMDWDKLVVKDKQNPQKENLS